MIIAIDTTPLHGFEVALVKQGTIHVSRSIDEAFQESEQLLPMIESMMKEQGCEMKDIEEIWVVNGPGRFTAVRIGVAIANALAYALNIFLRSTDRQSPDETMRHMIVRFVYSHPMKGVEPVYDREPNITQKR